MTVLAVVAALVIGLGCLWKVARADADGAADSATAGLTRLPTRSVAADAFDQTWRDAA